MGCYYHREQEAAAQCQKCGKVLCRECASLYQTPYCAECAKADAEAVKADTIKLGVLGVIIAITMTIFLISDGGNPLSMILPILAFACLPFGWRTLTAITPRMFLMLPIIGWLIYFFIKVTLSALIGWIAAPVKIYKTKQICDVVATAEEQRKAIHH